MNKLLALSLLCLFNFNFLFSHEGHKDRKGSVKESIHSTQGEQSASKQFGRSPQSWMQWIGSFHFIFLHFPIALITMTAIAELLFAHYQQPSFSYAARFMLISTAILGIPTAFLGLIYSYTASYTGLLAAVVCWHMWFGMTTAAFTIIVVFLREHDSTSNFYYTCLVLLFLLVNITGFLGGEMTFGLSQMGPLFF